MFAQPFWERITWICPYCGAGLQARVGADGIGVPAQLHICVTPGRPVIPTTTSAEVEGRRCS